MEQAAETKKLVPPYLAYKTFRTFLDALKVTTPSRIDKSVMPSMSGANQSALLMALKYLRLIQDDGTTLPDLTKLAKATDTDRKKYLKELLTHRYPFMFSETIKLQSATPRQIEEEFDKKSGASGDTVKKCIAFFLAAAKDADVEISSFLNKMRYTKTSKPTRSRNGTSIEDDDSDSPVVQPKGDWAELLMSKFPTFDPAWPDEVKTKWFDGFKQMMDTMKEKE